MFYTGYDVDQPLPAELSLTVTTCFFIWDVADDDLESMTLDIFQRFSLLFREARMPSRTCILPDWSDNSLSK